MRPGGSDDAAGCAAATRSGAVRWHQLQLVGDELSHPFRATLGVQMLDEVRRLVQAAENLDDGSLLTDHGLTQQLAGVEQLAHGSEQMGDLHRGEHREPRAHGCLPSVASSPTRR